MLARIKAWFFLRVVLPYLLWKYRRKRNYTPRPNYLKRTRGPIQLRRIRRAQAKRAYKAWRQRFGENSRGVAFRHFWQSYRRLQHAS